MNIHVEVIPHNQQRYPTCGDYWVDETGTLQIRISEMGGTEVEIPVLIHELVEWLLLSRRGVALSSVDEFDQCFELERKLGLHKGEEPGDHPDAPYRREHRFAENIERQVVQELGMHWDDYEQRIP